MNGRSSLHRYYYRQIEPRAVGSLRAPTALEAVQSLGLTSGLQLVLDAGDADSYTSGASWLDRSGNGYDFFLGVDGTSQPSDPTFNGVAGGRSASEYFSFDGGDLFAYDSANETWMENIHKDNAIFTLLCWVYPTSVTSARFGGTGATSTQIGFTWGTSSTGLLNQAVYAGGGVTSRAFNGPQMVVDAWQCIGWSHNEATGTNGAITMVNGTTALASSTYTTPTASNATYNMKLGAVAAGASALAAGSRMAQFLAWGGVALTSQQMVDFFEATRGRYGV